MNNKKVAVIFPGMGYHSDKPLLYFSKRIAIENGYEIVEVNYDLPYKAREIMNDKVRMKESFELAASQIKEALCDISFSDYNDVVFIGKSIGTALAAHYDNTLQVRARHLVFTPVPQTFDLLRKNAGIVFHGLDDPWCPTEIASDKCNELGLELYTINKANHSLETKSVLEDIRNLKGIMQKVKHFFSPYKVVMFDLDGTLTDSGRAIISSVEYALSHFGITDQPRKKLETFIGPSLYDSFVREYDMNDEDCNKAVSLYRDIYEKERMYDVDIYDGIPELLGNLKEKGFTVILITSKPLVFAEKILERIGLSKYFDHMVGPDLSDHSSDKKPLIEKAITSYELGKNACIMIGDTAYDIKGAADAGIDSIAVTYGYGNTEDMVKEGATFLVDSAKEIMALVQAISYSNEQT